MLASFAPGGGTLGMIPVKVTCKISFLCVDNGPILGGPVIWGDPIESGFLLRTADVGVVPLRLGFESSGCACGPLRWGFESSGCTCGPLRWGFESSRCVCGPFEVGI